MQLPSPPPVSRRDFLQRAVAAPLALVLPASAKAGFWEEPRHLRLYRPETGERVHAVYWENGKLSVDGYVAICSLMRDIYDEQTVQMSIGLLDILRGVAGYLEPHMGTPELVLTDGFRTANTLKRLIERGLPAASRSMHLYGKAGDLRVAKVPPTQLARIGLALKSGGVGLYDKTGHVHLDDGRARFWRKTR